MHIECEGEFGTYSCLAGKPYRYGGEEFAVVVPRAGSAGALQIAERIRQAVTERRPAGIDVTVSIGVASMSQLQQKTPEALLAAADKILYAAKAAGRNCVRAHAGPPTPPPSRPLPPSINPLPSIP